MNDPILLAWFCLVIAAMDQQRTVYHSRIDGLLIPAEAPFEMF